MPKCEMKVNLNAISKCPIIKEFIDFGHGIAQEDSIN